MTSLAKLQRALYLAQRGVGDVRAAQRGPGPLVKRIVRRKITAKIFSAGRRAL